VIEFCRWAFSIVLPAIAAALLLVVVRAKLRDEELPTVLIVAVATGFVAVTLLGTQFLIRALREHRESEARFQQMASNIQEIFWMIDAETKKALYVNDAYQTITGRSCQSLTDNPTSYKDVIHPEDRDHVLAKLEEATRTGRFNERFRIVSAHRDVHWVTAHGFPVRDAAGKIWRLVGTA
jgi:PAS domain S-box-containing protein